MSVAMGFSPRLCVALLLVFGCSLVMSTMEDARSIGTAHAEVPSRGRRLLGRDNRGSKGRKSGFAKQSDVTTLANRRSLLQAMCSNSDNSPEAVVKCTNAMRTDPSAFKNEFRCSTYWMNNMGSLGELRMVTKMNQAAKKHSEDNARMGQLSHTGSDGSHASKRLQRTGYGYGVVRENIAYGYTSARDVVLGWMCSDGHRKNILSCDVSEIGVGLATGSGGRYYHTQVFACPRGGKCTCGGGSHSPSDQGGEGGQGGGHGGQGGEGGQGGGHGGQGGEGGQGGGHGGQGGEGGQGGGHGGQGGGQGFPSGGHGGQGGGQGFPSGGHGGQGGPFGQFPGFFGYYGHPGSSHSGGSPIDVFDDFESTQHGPSGSGFGGPGGRGRHRRGPSGTKVYRHPDGTVSVYKNGNGVAISVSAKASTSPGGGSGSPYGGSSFGRR